MTERFYYTNTYQTEFDATLLALDQHNGQPAARLDHTYFYPTSGGQPFDTGLLGDRRVVDVVAADNGDVWHLLDADFTHAIPGQSIHGVIDWSRRYDHMQQHSGQHLLSQIFYRHFGLETLSVHFGDVESTLDLDVVALEPTQIDEAEQIANRMVYASLPITAYFVADNELASIPLRKAPQVTGKIRIVEIAGFDYSACGGTHVHTTAEIGPIKLTRQERRRGQTRLTFLCGGRALRDYVEKHRLLVEAANLFSTDISTVPRLIERNLAQVKELQQSIKLLTEQQLAREASELAGSAPIIQEQRIVAKLFHDKDAASLKTLAQQLQQYPKITVLLAGVRDEKLTLIFARAADSPLHMGNLLRDTLRQFGGNGGGRPDFAQGGADPAVGQAVLNFALEQIRKGSHQ
jgi:alanyl-tRNA synthetase